MQLRIFTEPQQGATYDDLLAVALLAEELGFDAFFRSDHYVRIGEGSPLPGSTDAWITLAGLARDTSRIRLGTLVTPVTFRLPGPLAISVAGVDQMSGGRVELGLGAGWFDEEHRAYGIPYPPRFGQRFDLLEEQLAIVSGLWAADGPFQFTGEHYQLTDSPALPKPVQRPGPPIIIGGSGATRTRRLAVTYASEWNLSFHPFDAFVTGRAGIRDACETIGRDPDSIVTSVGLTVAVGEDEAEVARRAANIGRQQDELRANGLCGTPDEVIDRLGTWAEAGAERAYLQVLDLGDLDHLRLIAERVMPAVG
jgi:F420-dependent oxidoreductase-like protein